MEERGSRLRVMIDATYAARAPLSGTGIYIERVSKALAGLDEVEVETVVNPSRRAPAGGGVGSLRNLAADRWWTTVQLPRLARRAHADVLHHPLPAFSRWTRLPQVLTVHDLAFERFPQLFDLGFRHYARVSHRSSARAVEAVLCVSAATAAEVRGRWGVEAERIVVAPLGPGQELPAQRTAPRHFLYVGDDQPRKNLPVLLAAYAAYRGRAEQPLDLVLAGSGTGRGEGVKVEVRPTPERLAELYGSALALVHPSLHEGFGLTALEAMSAGAPVIASAIPALRELCGAAALYAEPHDPRAFTTAMIQIATRPRLREQLSEQGRRQAGQYSWEACALAHVEAYRLASSGPTRLRRNFAPRDRS